MTERKKVPGEIRLAVLTEAGYRCAVPTCRGILAIDLHHLVELSEGGSDEAGNLLALCPTCHALHHRGTIPKSALLVWKAVLASLNHGFDKDALDNLLFLEKTKDNPVKISGDGVLRYSNLIVADLAWHGLFQSNGPLRVYQVAITPKGLAFLEAWRKGERSPFLLGGTG